MTRIAFIFLFGALGQGSLNAQVDTTKSNSLGKPSEFRTVDSLTVAVNYHRLADSLKIQSWSDSLRGKINGRFGTLALSKVSDSLKKVGVSKGKIRRHTDQMRQKGDSLTRELNEGHAKLQQKVSARYDSWTNEIRRKHNYDSAGIRPSIFPGAQSTPSLPNTQSLPALPNPQSQPTLPGVAAPSAALNLPGTYTRNSFMLNTTDFAALNLSPDLRAVGGDYAMPSIDHLKNMEGPLTEYSSPLKEYKSQLAEYKSGLKDPSAMVESEVGQLSAVKELNAQAADANGLKNNEVMQVAEQMKSMDMEEMMKMPAVNHFEGNEKALIDAMTSIATYKKKYPSVPSIGELKKTWLPVNGLKGRPFRERFRIGDNLGVRSVPDTLLLELFPNASYRISGRFAAGMGFMYRLRLNTKNFDFDQKNPVWGTNFFVVAKTFKSVYIRLETDGTSYPKSASSDKAAYRDWRWSFLSGVQTNFRISTQCSGNVQMLYNFNSALKDGFPERLSLRVGVTWKVLGARDKK